jgi:hypothetical protein
MKRDPFGARETLREHLAAVVARGVVDHDHVQRDAARRQQRFHAVDRHIRRAEVQHHGDDFRRIAGSRAG